MIENIVINILITTVGVAVIASTILFIINDIRLLRVMKRSDRICVALVSFIVFMLLLCADILIVSHLIVGI